MVGSDFCYRFFWDKVFTEYDHETTLRYADWTLSPWSYETVQPE